MRTPKSVKGAKEFGRIRLSPTFFMREFLYGEIANIHGMTNLPQDPDLGVATDKAPCIRCDPN